MSDYHDELWVIHLINGDKILNEKATKPATKKDRQRIKKLEAELNRKEKAAETAALLVLSKKCHAIWGESEED